MLAKLKIPSEMEVAPCYKLLTLLTLFVGPLPRVRPRNGILALLLLVVPLRSEFIGEL